MVSQTFPQLNVEFSNVDFGFGGKPVLRGLDLTAHAGEVLAIVGPNGCGKSTTLKLLSGLHRPQAGEIRLSGRALGAMGRKEIARSVACLTQSGFAPPEMTVFELVAMGRFVHQSFFNRRSRQDEDKIAEAMQTMDVESLARRRVGELSGGQLQRCRMAMTLAQDAPVLLLDEPTTFLDLRYQYGILEAARQQAQSGRTVIAVLHDFMQASIFADRIAVLHEGRLACVGKPLDVLTEDVISRVFGVETRMVSLDGAVFHVPATLAEEPA